MSTADEVCGSVNNGADVVVIDGDTGEDITRMVFAHWEDSCLVDPIGERRGWNVTKVREKPSAR
jgi:hypothetical protein